MDGSSTKMANGPKTRGPNNSKIWVPANKNVRTMGRGMMRNHILLRPTRGEINEGPKEVTCLIQREANLGTPEIERVCRHFGASGLLPQLHFRFINSYKEHMVGMRRGKRTRRYTEQTTKLKG